MLNAQNPRALPYFTPPALPIAIAGETLAQWTNQGVDIWSCSPAASLVEEEVVRWLCDLVGYRAGSFGVLTSGGVMANLMAMTVARDVHLADMLGLPAGGKPRGGELEGAARVRVGPDALLDPPRARYPRGSRRTRCTSSSPTRSSGCGPTRCPTRSSPTARRGCGRSWCRR